MVVPHIHFYLHCSSGTKSQRDATVAVFTIFTIASCVSSSPFILFGKRSTERLHIDISYEIVKLVYSCLRVINLMLMSWDHSIEHMMMNVVATDSSETTNRHCCTHSWSVITRSRPKFRCQLIEWRVMDDVAVHRLLLISNITYK